MRAIGRLSHRTPIRHRTMSCKVSRAGAGCARSYEAGRAVSRNDNSLTHPVLQDVQNLLTPPATALLSALAKARAGRIWLVGGAIRDAVAGLSVADVDVSIAGDAG